MTSYGFCAPLCVFVTCRALFLLYLVVRIKLLVLSLALTQGLSLSLKRLRQVSVLQAFLRVLLRQHFDLPLKRQQLLPTQTHKALC